MTLIKGLLAIVFSSILFSQSALALQFTYHSKELNFIQGYLAGEASDLVGPLEPPFPSFSAVLSGTTENLTTTFTSGDLTEKRPSYQQLVQNLPALQSSITLTPDGNIAAWHFLLALSITTTQTPDSPGGTSSWLAESSYGVGTCNCDSYKVSHDIFTQRPYYSWQYVNTVGVLFAGENTLDNWVIDRSEVPEPATYLLLLAGLAMIAISRHKRKYSSVN